MGLILVAIIKLLLIHQVLWLCASARWPYDIPVWHNTLLTPSNLHSNLQIKLKNKRRSYRDAIIFEKEAIDALRAILWSDGWYAASCVFFLLFMHMKRKRETERRQGMEMAVPLVCHSASSYLCWPLTHPHHKRKHAHTKTSPLLYLDLLCLIGATKQ